MISGSNLVALPPPMSEAFYPYVLIVGGRPWWERPIDSVTIL